MKKPILEKSIDIAGRPLSLQVGKFAEQADASVLGRYGDTIVLVTVVCGPKTENGGFLPLRVDYEEKLYAGGRIKGSRFVKREGRPSEEAVLNARIIDRSIRPLFPKDFPREVQVVVTVLSIDLNNDPVLTAIAATSAALLISGIPWKGPLAAVKVGLSNGDFILNPRENELEFSHLDLLVSGTQKEIIMIEAAAEEIPEEQIIKALEFSTPHLDTLNKFIQEFASPAAEPEIAYEIPEIDPALKGQLLRFIKENFPKDSLAPNHKVRDAASEEFLQTLYERFEGKCSKQEMKRLFEQELKHVMREQILKEGKRFDGRSLDEIRPLEIEVDLLPRTHGSAMFRRGGTQVLTITTLASTSLEQLIETMTGEETKRYIHHYNFPPFSTGEVGRLGYPKRREIGHGALAEKALLPVIPGEKTFPYTIRVVSEVLSSAGSTSQASVCGSSLSLMDAGVPIKSAVAGIAMGLINEGGRQFILSDIAGLEDFFGDMDFKAAGTEKGITALQLDTKTGEITTETLSRALNQAREGRLHILAAMNQVISEPRKSLSRYAPHIISLQVDAKKIGKIIGPGGSTVRAIQESTETAIDLKDNGTVLISGPDDEKVQQAKRWIEGLSQEVRVGTVYTGKVKQVVDFGAFVEIFPGKEGLVHISEISPGFIKDIRQHIKEGDVVKVKVIGVDERDRVSLSIKQAESDKQPVF